MKLCVITLLFLYVRGSNLGFLEKTIWRENVQFDYYIHKV